MEVIISICLGCWVLIVGIAATIIVFKDFKNVEEKETGA